MARSNKRQVSNADIGKLMHDIKNQITSIKAFNQLNLRKSDNKEIEEYSNSIEERSEELISLLDDLTDKIRE